MDVSNIAIVIIITLISKSMGFLREVLIGAYFGATSTTDAYFIAMTIPNIIFDSIVAVAVATVFIPVYFKARNEKGESAAQIFSNNLIIISSLFCIIISIIGVIFSRQIVLILGFGFDQTTLNLAIGLTSISMIMITFVNLTYIFSAFLQAKKLFAIPASIGLLNNAIIIVALLFSQRIGIMGLVAANLIGSVCQLLLVYIFALRSGFKFRCGFNLSNRYIKYWAVLLGPVLIGLSIQQVNTLINRMLASGLIAGSIAALSFSSKVTGFVYGVFSLSVATVIFPKLSSLDFLKDKKTFIEVIVASINTVSILTIPVMAGIILLNQQIVTVLFERGAFTAEATRLTASALLYYALGIVFYGYRDILNKVFYALHDTKTPMINGSIAIAINIVLNLLLIGPMQHNGLALATSLSALITTVMLFYSLYKAIGTNYLKNILPVLCKSTGAATFMVIIILACSQLIGVNHAKSSLLLFLYIVIGIITYFIAIATFKIKEFDLYMLTLKTLVKNYLAK